MAASAPERDHPRPPFPRQSLERPGQESLLEPRPRYEARSYRPSAKLQGKRVLITGGDSGIGRAVAVLFAREGADVAITHLPEEQTDANETLDAVQAEGVRGVAFELDVRDADSCAATVDEARQRLEGLDILVNNAAFQRHVDALEEITLDQWDHCFRTNIYGYFHMVRAALPYLEEGSCIINTGSITGLEGSKNAVDYAATNGAVHALTKSLAMHLLDRGIRVNCVAPGPVWTPLNPADRDADEVAEFGADNPMGRPAQPDEIAPAYVYLASEADSSYMTGQILTILGGSTRAG